LDVHGKIKPRILRIGTNFFSSNLPA
jgi:hypothetical protein